MSTRRLLPIYLLTCLVAFGAADAAAEPVPAFPIPALAGGRYESQIDPAYEGAYGDDFQRLRYEIPNLLRQSLIDIAVETGLNFQEGWGHPLVIRFSDGQAEGAESTLAHVDLLTDGKNYSQQLTINLAAYADKKFNFEKVLRHELVHAMLNDALGARAVNVPRWLHEGLAIYGAGQGEQMINAYLSRVETGEEEEFVNGLGGRHRGKDYVEDYLAVQYIRDRHGVNSIHAFTRELVGRKGDVPAAIQASCSEDWESFQANARQYALDELVRIKRTLRGTQAGPF